MRLKCGAVNSPGTAGPEAKAKTILDECAMTCPEYNAAEGKCGVDGFKFYTGMQKPCETPGISKEKCPRFAMQ
ncbi:MAG: hypothetical protein ACFFBL_01010 [Promethearchaeota archaeon]